LLSELKRLVISALYTKNLTIEGNSPKKLAIKYLNDVQEQVAWTKKVLAKCQLLPIDLDNIFSSQFSEGTYVASHHGQPVASISVWDGSSIRSSKFKSDAEFLRNACIFYNVWTKEDLSKEQKSDYLMELLSVVGREKVNHDFVYVFLQQDDPLSPVLQKRSELHLAWKARLWNWDSSFRFDPQYGCNVAYDPRDSLH